jgi:hypothetical protein
MHLSRIGLFSGIFDVRHRARFRHTQFVACRPHLLTQALLALLPHTALLRALREGWIAGAALDVIEGEPEGAASLADAPGVLLTPHVAWFSSRSVQQLRRSSAQEIVRFLKGEPLAHPVA